MGGRGLELGLADTRWYMQIQIKNKVLLYSTGNYIQFPVISQNGKGHEKDYLNICVCVTESLCCIAVINT